ncbi:MAG: hypothetical protein RLZZ369_1553 [Pseudomonadota bacterium]
MRPDHKTVYTLQTMSDIRKTSRRTPRLSKVDAAAFPDGLSKTESTAHGDDTTVTQQIVQAITQAIVEHRLKPGTKLVEQTIGNSFGVSRTLVRQALFKLQQVKLVTQEPARGTFVAQPSITEAREVFAVRRMIEGQMLRDLIARITPADVKRLKAHIKAEQQAVQKIDVAGRTTLLFDFHVLMAQMQGNQVLVDLMAELVSRCSLITLMYQSAADAYTSHTEHAAILQAIENRDAELAVAVMAEHLLTVERQLTEHPRVAHVALPNPTSVKP